jgi:hypothetical protein
MTSPIAFGPLRFFSSMISRARASISPSDDRQFGTLTGRRLGHPRPRIILDGLLPFLGLLLQDRPDLLLIQRRLRIHLYLFDRRQQHAQCIAAHAITLAHRGS